MGTIPPLDQVHVDIRTIERELAEIWKNVADESNGTRSAVTRTCVLNLLVLSFDGMKGIEPATAIIDRLTNQHPNRAIVVGISDTQQGSSLLDAWVQAHCQMPAPGRPQVCCEQITIEARGSAATGRVAGLVLQLLVPDLPVMLWLPDGAWADREVVRRLSDIADRVIVDTATFADPAAALLRIAALTNSHGSVSDLAWGRLTAWRELVAQFFDAREHQQYLEEIQRVAIDYAASEPAARVQALLLAGWMASRLGWQFVAKKSENAFELQRGDERVQVEVRPNESAAASIGGVEIICERARFGVVCDAAPDRALATAEIGGVRQLRHTARLDVFDQAELLAHELRLLGHDQTYVDALHIAAAMVERRRPII